MESLKRDLEDRKRRQARLIEAVETVGDISVLTKRLRDLESDIKGIQESIACRHVKRDEAITGIREHVSNSLLQLGTLLLADTDQNAARAKEALAKHVGKLVLTPSTRDGRPIYKVTGGVTIRNSDKSRMQVVARDGIEPPTPAFSGPASPKAKRLIPFVLATIRGIILVLLLEQLEQESGTGFSLQFTAPDDMSFPMLSIARLWDSGTNCW